MAKMSDGEVTSRAYKKLTDDLDHIEADTIFAPQDNPQDDTHSGVKISAHGVDVTIKPMDGEQTKLQPKELPEPEEDEKKEILGK